MTTKKITYIILMLLPIATAAAVLPFLPEEIPVHYGFGMTADRWGSRFESLIFPVCIIVFGLFMLLAAKLAGITENNNNNNQKIVLTVGLVILVLFNVMNLYFEYLFFNLVTDMSDMLIDILSLVVALLGVCFIIIGNIMPKAKKNWLVGFRTPWTMKNELIWKKCQFFAGVTMILAGIIIAVSTLLFFKGISSVVFLLIVTGIMITASVVYSYFAMKKYSNISDDIDCDR